MAATTARSMRRLLRFSLANQLSAEPSLMMLTTTVAKKTPISNSLSTTQFHRVMAPDDTKVRAMRKCDRTRVIRRD